MATRLTLFDLPPPSAPPAVAPVKPGQVPTMPQQQAQAQAAGQELIRLDKRPYEQTPVWIIKRYTGTGWQWWQKFFNEAEAVARYEQLLADGKHIEG